MSVLQLAVLSVCLVVVGAAAALAPASTENTPTSDYSGYWLCKDGRPAGMVITTSRAITLRMTFPDTNPCAEPEPAAPKPTRRSI